MIEQRRREALDATRLELLAGVAGLDADELRETLRRETHARLRQMSLGREQKPGDSDIEPTEAEVAWALTLSEEQLLKSQRRSRCWTARRTQVVSRS